MPLNVDLSRFNRFARDIAAARGKPEAEVVNKGLATVIIGSSRYPGLIKLLPKAQKARIRAALKENDLNVRLSVKKLKQEGYFKTKRTRAEIQQKIAEMCKARLTKELRSIGYIAASWLATLPDLGMPEKKSAAGAKLWDGGTAAQSFGVKAVASRLTAKAVSKARGAEQVMAPYVQQAVDNAANDMRDYFLMKIGRIYARISKQ